ncbi:MAG: hypothetical protein ACYTG0_29685 [Planctomycetota bacterium]
MQTVAHELEDLFTLNVVAPHLKGFLPPEGPHDPKGDWKLAYGVYTLGSIRGHGGRVGSLVVERRAAGQDQAVVAVQYEKRVPPRYDQKVVGEITCRADALATPIRWSFSSQIGSRADGPVENTALEQSAVVQGEEVEIRDRHGVRSFHVARPFTVNWALFEAVGRLAREPFDPIRFTLLDHFDQLKPEQVLSYRQSAVVRLAGREVPLHAYDHLGQGIVPWIYWVDDRGRLLFVVSGLEAYLLTRPGATTQ